MEELSAKTLTLTTLLNTFDFSKSFLCIITTNKFFTEVVEASQKWVCNLHF